MDGDSSLVCLGSGNIHLCIPSCAAQRSSACALSASSCLLPRPSSVEHLYLQELRRKGTIQRAAQGRSFFQIQRHESQPTQRRRQRKSAACPVFTLIAKSRREDHET